MEIRVTIEIKMMNTSGVRADWIDVAVQDSLSEQMKKGLEELQGGSRQLTAYERYQLEYELVARPVVRVRWSESIGAHGVGWVRLTCLGKAGCRWVGVRIEYDVDGGANLKRQLEWRMDLSVQKSLALVGLETLPGGVLIIKVRNSAQGGQVFEVHAKGMFLTPDFPVSFLAEYHGLVLSIYAPFSVFFLAWYRR
jgi:hypothetical protein